MSLAALEDRACFEIHGGISQILIGPVRNIPAGTVTVPPPVCAIGQRLIYRSVLSFLRVTHRPILGYDKSLGRVSDAGLNPKTDIIAADDKIILRRTFPSPQHRFCSGFYCGYLIPLLATSSLSGQSPAKSRQHSQASRPVFAGPSRLPIRARQPHGQPSSAWWFGRRQRLSRFSPGEFSRCGWFEG